METLIITLFLLLVAGAFIYMIFAHKSQRYHEPDSRIDERIKDDFGDPVRSLYTNSEIFTLHHDIDITDENEKVIYHAKSKFFTLTDDTVIERYDGKKIADIERKFFTIHAVHYINMHDGTSFTLSKELFHLIKDVTRIDELGWMIEGNILQLNFVLRDKDESIIAVISQKMFSIHDKYSIDVYKPEYEEIVVAIVITLQHMIIDRENSSSAAASSSN